jgi:tetratricopeptide (TPR) repeat protein
MSKIAIPVLFPIPTDEDDFEDLCVDILRIYWNRPGLERYGRKGERQNGIDILDLGGVAPLHAAQCKLKEFQKTLSPTSIAEEVADACNFEFQLGRYGILTTAKVSTQAQKKILEINQRHRERSLFEVELLTWGKLCQLIQRYDDVRRTYFELTVITTTSRIGSKSPIVAQHIKEAGLVIETVGLTAEIDATRDAVNKREFQNALLLLNRILQREDFGSISAHDRFRISSNLAFAELGLGRPEVAAQHFFDAFGWEPTDERAKTNEVFAYILTGKHETAYEKATALRKEYPNSTKLAANWVISAPRSASLSSMENELEDVIKKDGEVNLALSQRALMEMEIGKGVAYAQAALNVLPESSQPPLFLARAYMGWIVRAEKGLDGPGISREELEREIDTALVEALRFAEVERDTRTQAEALVLRADLRMLQKRAEEAESDAYAAIRIDPDNVQALLALSHLQGSRKRIDESISLLDRAYRKGARPEAALMYARALAQRGLPEDLQLAASILSTFDISTLLREFRPVIASTAVDVLVRRNDLAGARNYIEGVRAHLDREVVTALLAHIVAREGNKDEAQQLALQAKQEIGPSSSVESKEFLARLFMRLEMPAEALPLFQELFDLNTQSFDSGMLLDCAARLHRDDVVIATCAELEKRGQDPWEVVSFEVQYLQKYSRERALVRLDVFLSAHPGHKLGMLMRSVIGVQSQEPSLVNGTIEALPTVEELSPDYIIPAIHVLRFAGAGNATVDYAYRFLRLHFDDIRAHQAMMLSLMPGDPSIILAPSLDTVAENAAVAVHEALSGNVRWFVLENTDRPDAAFEEIPLNSELAKELLGKHVGDTVVLAKGYMESRTGTVRQILPKYVRRFQDCMGEMRLRFGAASSVESVHLGTTEEEVNRGLQKVLDSAKRREASILQVRRIYDENPIPLHLFGDRFGKNAYLALAFLAQQEDQAVKCCFGTPEERRQSIFALQTCNAVVLDITAIATIRMIGCEDLVFEAKRFHFQMSEGTFNELQETLIDDLFSGSTSGTIAHREGVSSFTEETAEQKAVRRQEDQNFLDRLKAAVEIVPVMELSALEPAKREPLEEVCGSYGAETMLLASHPDAVLWTDDLIQAELAKTEFGVKRAWTEIIAEQTMLAGQITDAVRQRIVASLIGMNYTSTYLDSAIMLKAVEMSDATPWRFPFRQFLQIFQKPTGNLQTLLGIFVDFVIKLYRADYLPESRCRIVIALLDALWRSVPLRLPLLHIRRNSAQFFGLNPVGQNQFDKCFDQWYATVPDKIVGGSHPS